MNKHNAFFHWVMLFFITLLYFFANMQKVLVPGATFNEIQQIFSLDAASVTGTGAYFLYVYAAAQIIIGILADRFSGVRVIIVGGMLFSIGSVMSALTISFPLLCFSRCLTGLGAATIYLSMAKEFAQVAGNGLAFYLGIAVIIGYAGAVTGSFPFISGVSLFGYEKMMWAAGIFTFAVYIGFLLAASKNKLPTICTETKLNLLSFFTVFKKRHNIFLMLTFGINFGTYFALQSVIGKKFLEDFCRMSSNSAGVIMTVTVIIAALNGFMVAVLSRLAGNRRKIFILFSSWGTLASILIIFIAILSEAAQPFFLVFAFILLAFAGNVSPVAIALVKETNDENCFGTILSINNGFAYAVTAIVVNVMGKLMNIYPPETISGVKIYSNASYALAFGALLLLVSVSAVSVFFLKESFGKNIVDNVY